MYLGATLGVGTRCVPAVHAKLGRRARSDVRGGPAVPAATLAHPKWQALVSGGRSGLWHVTSLAPRRGPSRRWQRLDAKLVVRLARRCVVGIVLVVDLDLFLIVGGVVVGLVGTAYESKWRGVPGTSAAQVR